MRPTARGILLLASGLPVAALPALLGDRFWVAWAAYAAVSVLALGLDAALVWPRRRPAIAASLPPALAVGAAGVLAVEVQTRHRPSPGWLEAECEVGSLFGAADRCRIALARGRGRLEFSLTARRRGTATVKAVWLRWRGPLGLMSYQIRRVLDLASPVVPDLPAVRRAALQFFASNELMTGEKVERHTGDGSEFERMREFVPGLDHRAMDWKSSARHRKLLCREFRAERNHQIVLACDTGHLMSEPVAGLPKLDHAIAAALLLGYVSLRVGDRVGLYGFDAEARVYVAPQGGLGTFTRLQLATAELDYSTAETNFTLGLASLTTRLRRRSLIVVLTDFVDSISAELMVEDLQRLARHHLVLFVAVRNPELETIANEAPVTVPAMARSVVAADLVRERQTVLRTLERYGVQVIDAVPAAISPLLLNRYLDIKRRELIA